MIIIKTTYFEFKFIFKGKFWEKFGFLANQKQRSGFKNYNLLFFSVFVKLQKKKKQVSRKTFYEIK